MQRYAAVINARPQGQTTPEIGKHTHICTHKHSLDSKGWCEKWELAGEKKQMSSSRNQNSWRKM